jgi:hypothetical protein
MLPRPAENCMTLVNGKRFLVTIDTSVHTCHAGIQYASAPIIVAGQRLGMVTAGQFPTQSPDPIASAARAAETSSRLSVGGMALAEAMDSIEIVSHERALQITKPACHHRQRYLRHRLAELPGAANAEPDCTTVGGACVGLLLPPPAGLSSRGGERALRRRVSCAGNPSAGCTPEHLADAVLAAFSNGTAQP